jgi:hypothetical protein
MLLPLERSVYADRVPSVFYDAEEDAGACKLDFRLTYRGNLPAETSHSHVKIKHEIRQQLHPQLVELWSQNPFLRAHRDLQLPPHESGGSSKSILERIADKFRLCGHRFMPLIRREAGSTCSLDILFLRRDSPGGLIRSGGDIDNRIKVLFDGLQMPHSCSGIPEVPGEGEDPFHCLLEDDTLITEAKITTDRLLTPLNAEERIHAVELVIHVTTTISENWAAVVKDRELFNN